MRSTRVPVQPLGAGRWRVRLRGPVGPDGRRAALSRDSIRLRPVGPAAPAVRVETLTPPSPSDPGLWSLVVSLDAGPGPAGFAYQVEAAGWPGWMTRVDLRAGVLEEPSPAGAAGDPGPLVDLDYGARDFTSLRAMMLSRLTDSFGSDFGSNPVGQGVALIEQLAYLGDSLSYYQDAVATEAYLATARRRVSVTRHAALLDYQVGQGSSARTWVRVNVATAEPFALRAGTKLLSHIGAGPVVTTGDVAGALGTGAVIFETLTDVTLQPEQAPLALTPVAGDRVQDMLSGSVPTAGNPPLAPGDLILIQPQSGFGPLGGHVVRLQGVEPAGQGTVILSWGRSDAIAASSDLLTSGARLQVWAHNLVLADHGSTQEWATLPAPVRGRRYWPVLPYPNVTFSAGAVADDTAGAAELMAATGYPVRAAVQLSEVQDTAAPVTLGAVPSEVRDWSVRQSLLESGPLALDFVVETEDDGTARLRFGDGTHGMQPEPGAVLEVRQRVGGGAQGNIGAGALAHIVLSPGSTDLPGGAETRIASVTNPVAAVGGSDPEALSAVRLHAPDAFRINDRVVTIDDYIARAGMNPGIVDVTAVLANTGSWPVALVYVQTVERWQETGEASIYRADLAAALRLRQPVGFDVDVRPARPMPVEIVLDVTVLAGWALSLAGPAIDGALMGSVLAPGFFTFGRSLHQSEVIALVTGVDGVADVTVARLAPVGDTVDRPPRDAIVPPFGYVLRIDNDLAAPAQGSITYRLRAAS